MQLKSCFFVRIIGIFALLFFSAALFSIGRVSAKAHSLDPVYLPIVMRPEPSPTPPPGFAERVVELTNQQRQSYGCAPVTMDVSLLEAAQGHSQDMALNDFFSHQGSDGSWPDDRIEAQGYSWSSWGENIAAGYTSPESVIAGWMNSPGHRANILNCSFVHIGVGYYYLQSDTGNVNYHHYWTQVFGAPR